uniref:Uncharacterized protein n=1 Tax=Rhizophora mucronata TaxID=61149 RepID=A0A2P2IS72_RHIMU
MQLLEGKSPEFQCIESPTLNTRTSTSSPSTTACTRSASPLAD